MDATVTEIHDHPLRPAGFEEPLFLTRESRKQILEHLSEASWLSRASLAPPSTMREGRESGSSGRVITSWREVDRWWEPDGGIDAVWRLLECGEGRQEIRADHSALHSAKAA